MKRLSVSTGEVDPAKREGDSADRVVRSAILVHAGPENSKLVFESADGEIAFDEARIKRIVDNQNMKISALAEQYGGIEKMPQGAFPPILDSHDDDSNNRVVGRFTGLLKFEIRDVPKVGKNVPCATADLTFLGADTVARIHDGRIYHLSIGIDEDTDTLGEVSTVVEPAAPGAMLLKQKGSEHRTRLKQGDKKMPKAAQLKLMKASAKRLATLGQMSEGLSKLTKDLKGSKATIQMTRKEGDVTHRLMGLMKEGKLTPAEYKKMSVKKLAALPSEALDTVVESYQAREPQINPIQRGSTDAVDFAELSKGMKKKQIKNLTSETANDLVRMTGGKIKFKTLKMGEAENKDDKDLSGPHEEEINPGKDPHAVPGEGGDADMKAKFKAHMAECAKHLEAGDVEKAKDSHAAAMAHMEEHGDKHLSLGMGDVKSEDYQKGMADMESRVDELSTQLARFAGMVSELMDVEKEEGHDLAAEPEEDDDKKKLAAEVDKDKK